MALSRSHFKYTSTTNWYVWQFFLEVLSCNYILDVIQCTESDECSTRKPLCQLVRFWGKKLEGWLLSRHVFTGTHSTHSHSATIPCDSDIEPAPQPRISDEWTDIRLEKKIAFGLSGNWRRATGKQVQTKHRSVRMLRWGELASPPTRTTFALVVRVHCARCSSFFHLYTLSADLSFL